MQYDKIIFNLKQIIDSISLIEQYSNKFSKKDFCNDNKTIDAVLMQIIVIGESCSRLYKLGVCELYFKDIPWEEVRAMRNLIAHDYARVNPNEVWNAVKIVKKDFKKNINNILEDYSPSS